MSRHINIQPDDVPMKVPPLRGLLFNSAPSRYTNATPGRLWYGRHVLLILVTGLVNDDATIASVRSIIQCLDNEQHVHLLNRYCLISYNTPLARALDANRVISGNYRLALHIAVADDAPIQDAPEEYYAQTGWIDLKYDDQAVDYFKYVMQEYALIANTLTTTPTAQPRGLKKNVHVEPERPKMVNDLHVIRHAIDTPMITDYLSPDPVLTGDAKRRQRMAAKYMPSNSLFARTYAPTVAKVPQLGSVLPAFKTTIQVKPQMTLESQYMTAETGQMFGTSKR